MKLHLSLLFGVFFTTSAFGSVETCTLPEAVVFLTVQDHVPVIDTIKDLKPESWGRVIYSMDVTTPQGSRQTLIVKSTNPDPDMAISSVEAQARELDALKWAEANQTGDTSKLVLASNPNEMPFVIALTPAPGEGVGPYLRKNPAAKPRIVQLIRQHLLKWLDGGFVLWDVSKENFFYDEATDSLYNIDLDGMVRLTEYVTMATGRRAEGLAGKSTMEQKQFIQTDYENSLAALMAENPSGP